jgi:hypothetical protein
MTASYKLVYGKGVFLPPFANCPHFLPAITTSGHPATRARIGANPLESYMSIYFYINKYKYKYPSLRSFFPSVSFFFLLTYLSSLFSWTYRTHPLPTETPCGSPTVH